MIIISLLECVTLCCLTSDLWENLFSHVGSYGHRNFLLFPSWIFLCTIKLLRFAYFFPHSSQGKCLMFVWELMWENRWYLEINTFPHLPQENSLNDLMSSISRGLLWTFLSWITTFTLVANLAITKHHWFQGLVFQGFIFYKITQMIFKKLKWVLN